MSRFFCMPDNSRASALRQTLGVAFTVMGAIAHSPVHAATPSTSQLEEITVTASKRSENLQDVPLSVTALTAESLERSGVASFADYAEKIPNLTFSSGHGVAEGRLLAIRGVQGASTTGFYIDDMPVPSTIDPRVIDLARLEVLRGPQGTLYGARSMGGTVRLLTTAPDPAAFSAKAHLLGGGIDGGNASYQADATVNAPLNDRMALRVTGYTGEDGAYITRRWPTASKKIGRNQFTGGIASLLWEVTDSFSIRPTILHQESKQDGLPLADGTPGTLLQDRTFDLPEKVTDRWTYGGVTMNYHTPVGDVTSVSSWFSRRSYEREDASEIISLLFGSPPLAGPFETWQPRHNFVQELRFTSAFSGPIQVTAGIYLQRGKYNYDQFSEVSGLNAAFGGALGNDIVYKLWRPFQTREDAAFGEVTYRISPHWSVLGGVRHSKIRTYGNQIQSGPAAGGFVGNEANASESKTTPKLVLQYTPNDDLNVYGLAAQGFRPGAAQIAPPPAFCAADYARLGVTFDQLQAYDSDSLWNYEIGAKMRFADRRVRLNTALFWIDWNDLQQVVRMNCGYGYVSNVGKARSRGAEIELSASVTDRLSFGAGVGYSDAKITQSSALVPAKVGSPIQQIAPWTVNADVDYTMPLTASLAGVAHLDGAYVDRSFSASNDVTNPRLRKSYTILNLRAGVDAGKWSVMAFARNLTNEHANLGDNQSQAAELPGRPRWYVNLPRTYGLEATFRW